MARYAISDIHGCNKTFQELLLKIGLKDGDSLFLLGDYINKGPNSKGVIDTIIDLQKRNLTLTVLRGNHEQKFIKAIHSSDKDYFKRQDKKITLKSFGISRPEDLPEKYFKFFTNLPYYAQVEKHFFVHAGLNFDIDDPFLDLQAMLNIRDYNVIPEKIGNKILIHGHVPQEKGITRLQISSSSSKINIDGGCVFYKNKNLRQLMALEIDTMQLYSQDNIEDYRYEIEVKK